MRIKYSTYNFLHLRIQRTFLRLAFVSAHFDSSSSFPVVGAVGHADIAIGPVIPDKYVPRISGVFLEAILT